MLIMDRGEASESHLLCDWRFGQQASTQVTPQQGKDVRQPVRLSVDPPLPRSVLFTTSQTELSTHLYLVLYYSPLLTTFCQS